MHRGSSFFGMMPPVTKNLILINVVVWLAMLVVPRHTGVDLTALLALHYFGASDFNPAQLITYMFMHSESNLAHLLFNMFALWMFGMAVERGLGSARFLFYYIACGIGAALCQELAWALTWRSTFVPLLANANGVSYGEMEQAIDLWLSRGQDLPFLNSLVTVGASGAVYGILLAFGMLWPDRPIYLMFIPIPIKAKWMVTGYAALELLMGIGEMAGRVDGVAHFAHLGGLIFGFVMIYYWKKKGFGHGTDFY